MSPSTAAFSAVSDAALADELLQVLGKNVRRSPGGMFELLRARGRHALPAISSAHFGREDEARIAEAFQHEQHGQVYALALEPLKNHERVFFASSTSDGLREFQRTCSHFNYALSAPDASAMVICTTDDYLVYAGSRPFVERCAGAGEAAALQSFREYADDPMWPQNLRRHLQSVYTTLAKEFPEADAGTYVRFPK
jgi:hypothetical protein